MVKRVLQLQVPVAELKKAAFLQVTHWVEPLPVQVPQEKWQGWQLPLTSLK
jgi:hypothetical protein